MPSLHILHPCDITYFSSIIRCVRQRKRWWEGRAGCSRMGAEVGLDQVRVCRTSSLNCLLVYSTETHHTCKYRDFYGFFHSITFQEFMCLVFLMWIFSILFIFKTILLFIIFPLLMPLPCPSGCICLWWMAAKPELWNFLSAYSLSVRHLKFYTKSGESNAWLRSHRIGTLVQLLPHLKVLEGS